MSAITHLLDYSDGVPNRAMASRQLTTKIPPSNVSQTNPRGEIVITLPANSLGQFLDFPHSGLEFKITNNDGDKDHFISPPAKSGFYSLIQRVSITCGGAVLDEIDNYSGLVDAMLSVNADRQQQQGYSALMMGTNGNLVTGDALDEEKVYGVGGTASEPNTRSVFLPLIYTGLYNASSLIPLFSRSPIQIRLTLHSVADAFHCGDAGITDANVVITDINFRCKIVEVAGEAFNQIVQANGGRFDLVAEEYQHTTNTIPALGAGVNTQVVSNLGLSMSSLNAVYFYFQNPGEQTAVNSKRGRQTSGMTNSNLTINGEKLPAREVELSPTNPAEAIAELLTANNTLGYASTGRLNDVAGKYVIEEATCVNLGTAYGTFVGAVDCKSQRSEAGSGGGGLIAGVSTLGQNLAMEHTFKPVGAIATNTAHYYGCFTALISLDLNGSQNFVRSV